MAVVIAAGLDKDMAGSPLLRGVSFKLERRDRMTLAGRNGTGKTTLLRMISGVTSIDGGELVFEKGAKVALHDQRPPRDRDVSLRDYVLSGCAELVALEATMQRLEGEMAERPEETVLLERYSRAQTRLEHAGGWDWRRRALEPLHGLGFAEEQLDRQLETFSGGELTRASLARALAGDPDLLLLDEPTNHLDISSLEWLESYLIELDAAVVLVAHDRWFLEAVGTSVLEIEAGKTRFFPGTWHAWRREQAAREMQLGKAIDKQQAEIARMEKFIERFRYKATKARQAQDRLKKLDKMEKIEFDPRDTRTLGFRFGAAERTGRVVLELEDGRLEVPGRTLLTDGEMHLERGEHVAFVGPNGAGKTTLIDSLAGKRALDGGRVKRGHNVKLGYLSQHAEELGTTGTVLAAAQRATGLTPGKARSLLGQFLFTGDDAEKPLEGLSGGERRRLSLAVLVHSDANVLILDEPTNHLDIDAREALEDALGAFEGSVLLVSHDRALLDAVGTRTIALEDGVLISHLGGWADYARAKEEAKEAEEAAKRGGGTKARPGATPVAGAKEARAGKAGASKSDARKAGASKGGSAGGTTAVRGAPGPGNGGRAKNGDGAAKPRKSNNARRRLAALERDVERAEAALKDVEAELAGSDAWSTPERSEESSARHAAAKRAVEEAYSHWEAAAT